MNEMKGYNSRLDPIQAAFLRAKLVRLDRWNEARRAIAARYLGQLRKTSLLMPAVPAWAEPVWHQLVFRCQARSQIQAYLEGAGIAMMIHYPIPPHLQDAYADLGRARGSFPIAECMADLVLSLPMGPHMDDESVQTVIRTLLEVAPA